MVRQPSRGAATMPPRGFVSRSLGSGCGGHGDSTPPRRATGGCIPLQPPCFSPMAVQPRSIDLRRHGPASSR